MTSCEKHWKRSTVKNLVFLFVIYILYIILNQNNRVLNKPTFKKKKTCNRRAEPCQLNKNRLTSNLIYKASVNTNNTTNIYIGSTTTIFKDRYQNHKASSTINKKDTVQNYETIYGN